MIHLLEQLTKLAESSKIFSAATSVDTLYEHVFDLVESIFKNQSAAILLRDPISNTLSIVASRGYDKELTKNFKTGEGQGITGTVLLTGKSQLITETIGDANYICGVKNAISEIAVPLKINNEIIGVLDMESSKQRFSNADQAMFVTFGDQVVAALKNLKLQASLEERARKLVAISKVGQSLTQHENLEILLDQILSSVVSALKLDIAAIQMWDEKKENLIVVAAEGYDTNVIGLKVPKGSGVTGKVADLGKPVIIKDVTLITNYISGLTDCRSEMAIPLIFRKKVIGVLNTEHKEINHFDQTDLLYGTIFADQAATAIKKTEMINELADRAKKLALIHQAACSLNTISKPDQILTDILMFAQKALGFDSVAVLTPSGDETYLTVRKALNHGNVEGLKIKKGKGFVGKMFLSGKAGIINDIKQFKNYIPGTPGARSEMAVPLALDGEIIGIIDAESVNPNAFTKEDLKLFRVFGSQAATALNNARLIAGLEEANLKLSNNVTEMQRLNEELEQFAKQIDQANKSLESQISQLSALHEAGKTITSSLDLDTTLQTILTMSSKIAGSTAGTIKLIDEETKELCIRAKEGQLTDETGSKSVLDLPLRIGNRTIGVFELVRKRKKILSADEQQMLETMASQAAIAIENARLFENTQKVYYETLKSLAEALEARDDYSRGHSERVANMSKDIATQLKLPLKEVDAIYNAALLHDIGKIGIRDEVLLAPRSLTADERKIIEQHPGFGNSILAPLKFLGEIRSFVRFHHERWDGKGYPDGLKAQKIPLASRIISVADTFDAMTSTRPYRKALSQEIAITEIDNAAGTQFDPAVVKTFLELIK